MTTRRSNPPGPPGSQRSFVYDRPRASNDHPDVSHTAANHAHHSGSARTIDQKIMVTLERVKWTGTTPWDVCHEHGLKMHSVSGRFTWLKQSRQVIVIGKRTPAGAGISQIFVLPEYARGKFKPEPEPEPVNQAQEIPEEDDEPAANSPEDLGLVTSAPRPYGVETPEPEKPTVNASSHAVQIPEIRKFVDWIHDQDLPVHADVKVGHCAIALSGLCVADLRWLCQAIRQAGRAPAPTTMKKAVFARDVSILRPGHDLETTQKRPKSRD